MLFLSSARRLERTLGIRPAAMRVVETIASAVLIVVVNIATGVITARLLGPVGRGELASILLGLQVVSMLAIVGLPTSAIYHIKKHPEHKSPIVGGSFALASALGLFSSVVGWMIIPHWLSDYPPTIVMAAQLTVLLAPLLSVYQVATPILRALDGFAVFNACRLLPPLLTLIALTFFALSGIRSPIAVSLTYCLPIAATLLWPLVWIWRDCRPELRGSGKQIALLLRFSARSLAIDLANTLTQYLDRILLVYLLAPSAVGLYVVAVSMAQPLKEIGWAIALVLFPKASGFQRKEAIEVSGLAARSGLLVMIAAGMPLVLIAPMLLGVFFGDAFLPAAPLFRLLVLAAILSSTAEIGAQAFMATGKPGIVSILRASEVAVLLALLLYFVPVSGVMGAAWSILAVACIRFVGTFACYPLILGKAPPRPYLNLSDIRRLRKARGRAQTQPKEAASVAEPTPPVLQREP